MIPRVTSVVWCGLSKSLVFKKKEAACHAFDPFRATKRESSLALPDAKDELIWALHLQRRRPVPHSAAS